jgi:glycosyltransferase involved in cell wall biosynthesis
MQRGNFVWSWSKFLSSQKPDWWFWRAADPIWPVLLIVARLKGVRGIFSAAYDTDVLPRIALVRRRRSWPLYSWGLSVVDRIFVQHHGQLSNLSPRLQSKASILPGLVVVPEKVKSRQERENYIVWVAVLRPHKRPDLLVELARATPDLHYVACGGTTTFGASLEFTNRTVQDLRSLPNIRYLGDVTHARTLETIANAAVLISTSDQEGFPNIFLEAWASGTPVISLTIDPDDLIKKRGLGFVSGTVRKAESDIRNLLKSPEMYESISKRARTYAEYDHCGASVVKSFNKVILDVEASSAISSERQPQ